MSQVQRPRLAFDPFFDSDQRTRGNERAGMLAANTGQANTGTVNAMGHQIPHVAPPDTYTSADNDTTLLGGRTLAASIPTLPRFGGARGTLTPGATFGGITRGTQPHNMALVDVVIDPHIKNQTATLSLHDLTPEVMAEAQAMAAEMTPEPQTFETLRLRGSATLQAAAAIVAHNRDGNGQQVYSQPPQAQAPGQTVVRSTPQRPHGQVLPAPNLGTATRARTVMPLQAFRGASPATSGTPVNGSRVVNMSQSRPVQQPQQEVAPPSRHVLFDIDGVGEQEAYYHAVQVETARRLIVLVYDIRYRGPKWFPSDNILSGDRPRQTALRIDGTGPFYLVVPTGVRYTHESYEFCVLMYPEAAEAPEDGFSPQAE